MVTFVRDEELGYFISTISNYEEYFAMVAVLRESGIWEEHISNLVPSELANVVAVLRLAGLTVEVEE